MTITFSAKHKSGFLTQPLQPFTFPGGEAHIKIDESFNPDDYEYHIADLRGHEPQDLFLLAMWAETLGSVDFMTTTYVILPYLPAARADRGNPNFTPYIMFFQDIVVPDHIITLDPHSPAWVAAYKSDGIGALTEFPFERIIKAEIQDGTSDSKPQPYVGVIAPDKGAHDRAQRAATVMGVPVYTAGKTRDFETGKLTGFHMEDELPETGKFLIVDDICDGGGTFNGLAEAIYKTNSLVELDLWVTHGIFSNESGLKSMTENFGVIHTTDSYFNANNPKWSEAVKRRIGTEIQVHSVTSYLWNEVALIAKGAE